MKTDCVVLVVEDDEDIRDVIGALLQEFGYGVALAKNGQEALQLLRSGTCRPCVILLDLWMPVMDGWQFREEQQKDASLAAIPVVELSGTGERGSLDAAAHLIKPVQFNPLVSTIERFCGPGTHPESPSEETDQPRLAAIRHARGNLLTDLRSSRTARGAVDMTAADQAEPEEPEEPPAPEPMPSDRGYGRGGT